MTLDELRAGNTMSETEVSDVENDLRVYYAQCWTPEDDYLEGVDANIRLRDVEQKMLRHGVSLRARHTTFTVPRYCCAKCLARHNHMTDHCPEGYESAKVLFKARKHLMLTNRRAKRNSKVRLTSKEATALHVGSGRKS